MSGSHSSADGRSRRRLRQRVAPENIIEFGTFEIVEFAKSSVCRGSLQQGDTACFSFVVLELVKV